MNPPLALVTGATGFIGRHLVAGLLDAGMRVVALVRDPSRLPDRLRVAVDCIGCTDWSEAGVRAALAAQPFDRVFHLAAYGVRPTDRDPSAMVQINIDLPAAIVRLCQERGATLVMAGTFSEYQRPVDETPLTEQSPLETAKIYGASKASGGRKTSALATSLGVRLRYLRFFHVYGEGEAPHRLLPSLVNGLARAEHVPLSAGRQIRDFLYVKDATEACIRAADDMASPSRAPTAIWNVCTGKASSVRAFATAVAQAMAAPAELLGFGDLHMRPDDEPYLVGDGECMRRDLGWRPRHDLDAGVRAAVASLMTEARSPT
jgi:nucleoside-diphosphate-sugar epimerase